MAENQNAAEQASTLNDERATRLAKRAALFEAGQNPYPEHSEIEDYVVDIEAKYAGLADGEDTEDDVKIGLPRDAQAILLIEVAGHAGQVADEALIVEEQLKKSGATQIVVAKDAEETIRSWEARRKALPALARFKPTTILEDATVPRSKIPAMMKVIKGLGEKYNLTVGTFGHAGDGNLHPTFMCDKRDKDEFERVERAVDELFNTTIEMGGTLSGEHGIGTAKQKWLEKETSRGTIGYSRRLRKLVGV